MDNRFIMTAFGKDRPGIVADVTRILFENGCNLQDTAMTKLADEFTLNLLFDSNLKDIEPLLEDACRKLEAEKNILAFVRPLQKRQVPRKTDVTSCTLHVEGIDHAGIVYKISEFLADNGLNIHDLKSSVKEEPGSGTQFYLMNIHVELPRGASMEHLEEGLSAVADELAVDITLTV